MILLYVWNIYYNHVNYYDERATGGKTLYQDYAIISTIVWRLQYYIDNKMSLSCYKWQPNSIKLSFFEYFLIKMAYLLTYFWIDKVVELMYDDVIYF